MKIRKTSHALIAYTFSKCYSILSAFLSSITLWDLATALLSHCPRDTGVHFLKWRRETSGVLLTWSGRTKRLLFKISLSAYIQVNRHFYLINSRGQNGRKCTHRQENGSLQAESQSAFVFGLRSHLLAPGELARQWEDGTSQVDTSGHRGPRSQPERSSGKKLENPYDGPIS